MDASQRRVGGSVVLAALTSLALVLASCGSSPSGEGGSAAGQASQAASSSTDSAPTAGAPSTPREQGLSDLVLGRYLQPFAVLGNVAVEGHVWVVPVELFAANLAEGEPSLRWCMAVPLGGDGQFMRAASDGSVTPDLSLLFGSQEQPDRSAGDYVSGAFDGVVLTGGAYNHGTGDEWAWSVTSVTVTSLFIGEGTDTPFGMISIYWKGVASENFSSRRGQVAGSVSCLLATPEVVEKFVLWNEADARSAEDDPDSWSTKPPPPPALQPASRDPIRAGDYANEWSTYEAGTYDEVVQHYTSHYGEPPIKPGGPIDAAWGKASESNTSVTRAADGKVEVFTTWAKPGAKPLSSD